jgi:hypothetical protein
MKTRMKTLFQAALANTDKTKAMSDKPREATAPAPAAFVSSAARHNFHRSGEQRLP